MNIKALTDPQDQARMLAGLGYERSNIARSLIADFGVSRRRANQIAEQAVKTEEARNGS